MPVKYRTVLWREAKFIYAMYYLIKGSHHHQQKYLDRDRMVGRYIYARRVNTVTSNLR